jgi:hypothetical protein
MEEREGSGGKEEGCRMEEREGGPWKARKKVVKWRKENLEREGGTWEAEKNTFCVGLRS